LSDNRSPSANQYKANLMLRSIGSLTVIVLLLAGCGGDGRSPPVIAAGSPPDGATGIEYPAYRFTVASGRAGPLTRSATGALPPGLALSSDGQLTGTPVSAGTYVFTVQVADVSIPQLTGTLPVSMQVVDSPIVVANSDLRDSYSR
jgi:hypothetical protein